MCDNLYPTSKMAVDIGFTELRAYPYSTEFSKYLLFYVEKWLFFNINTCQVVIK
jgi:hypothetical protein